MTLHPGDVAVVQRGVKHRFWTDTGVIFEEVSSTHFNNDSFYEDTAISNLPREARKTKLSNWGRHHFD
jgi:N-acetylneuraminate synthase